MCLQPAPVCATYSLRLYLHSPIKLQDVTHAAPALPRLAGQRTAEAVAAAAARDRWDRQLVARTPGRRGVAVLPIPETAWQCGMANVAGWAVAQFRRHACRSLCGYLCDRGLRFAAEPARQARALRAEHAFTARRLPGGLA